MIRRLFKPLLYASRYYASWSIIYRKCLYGGGFSDFGLWIKHDPYA